MTTQSEAARATKKAWRRQIPACLLALVVGLVVYHSNPQPSNYYDYTWRIAQCLWRGELGLRETPPSHLNEFVPLNGWYYSVFPLGSVVTMMPFAFLQSAFSDEFPARFLTALCAIGTTWFAFQLAEKQGNGRARCGRLALLPVLGSWMWCNTVFGGAWQIALAFAVLGQFGALYFTLVKRNALWAGAFFALAFGNRTEVFLTAPIFLFLWWKLAPQNAKTGDRVLDIAPAGVSTSRKSTRAQQRATQPGAEGESEARTNKARWLNALGFCALPFALGVATLLYNKARFGAFSDFGYARIPGVLQEENYRHGIFSLSAIPKNAQEMLFAGWRHLEVWPYWVPSGWGGSIFLSCPFLLLLFWPRTRDRATVALSGLAIAVLTFLLWIHGDPGGWQYSYRYAMVLLPWFFLILATQKPKPREHATEWFLLALSIGINAWGTYLWCWTPFVKP